MSKKTREPPRNSSEHVENAFERIVQPSKGLIEDIENISIRESVIDIEYLRVGISKLQTITMRGIKIRLSALVVISLALTSVGCFVLWLSTA